MGRPLANSKQPPREPKEARDFSYRLQQLYEKEGFKTYQEFAKAIGNVMPRGANRKAPTAGLVGQWLRGERTPTLIVHIKALCDLFQVDANYLLFGDSGSHREGKSFFSKIFSG